MRFFLGIIGGAAVSFFGHAKEILVKLSIRVLFVTHRYCVNPLRKVSKDNLRRHPFGNEVGILCANGLRGIFGKSPSLLKESYADLTLGISLAGDLYGQSG